MKNRIAVAFKNICFVVLGLYLSSCVSITWEENIKPELPFFENATMYAYINHPDIINHLSLNEGISDARFSSMVQSVGVSVFNAQNINNISDNFEIPTESDTGEFNNVEEAESENNEVEAPSADNIVTNNGPAVIVVLELDKASFNKKHQIMKHMNAYNVDDEYQFWTITFNNKDFLIDIGHKDILVIANNISLKDLKKKKFITSVPKEARLLDVNQEDSFWLWAGVDFFKQYLAAVRIGAGHGAMRIPEYFSNQDMKTSVALPYRGARSDFATLKLTLPFLFKSIDANILGSLPEVQFTSGVVTVKGLQLPPKTIKLFLDIIYSFPLFR